MSDPHHAEYAAAAAAIHDQTPRGCRLPAVGDWVVFVERLPGHETSFGQGRVQQVSDCGRVVIEQEGRSWFAIWASDIAEVGRCYVVSDEQNN